MRKLTINFTETDEEQKRCSKCWRWKALDAFSRNRNRLDGRCSQCKACRAAIRKRKYRDPNDRFWKEYAKKTQRIGGCVLWMGSCSSKGLPKCRWQGKTNASVRRIVYQLSRGNVPDDMVVLVTCKNKKCVNFLHLELGTLEDRDILKHNSAAIGDAHGSRKHPERLARGDNHYLRMSPELVRGEANGAAKLTTDDVRAIRLQYASGKVSQTQLAAKYGVSQSAIYLIVHCKKWAHVPDEESVT